MKRFFSYNPEHPSDFICGTMLVFSFVLMLFGLTCATPNDIFLGIVNICCTSAGLITDSIVVGGMGAAFVNAGLVTLITIVVLRLNRLAFSGISVACLFLMAGFALFGKDILNIFPILAGSYLYAKCKRVRFSHFLYPSLFGTALSPAVTEFALMVKGNTVATLVIMVLIGLLIGFVVPPISSYTLRIHQGYNLYNVGFAAGLVGMVIASLCKSFGYTFQSKLAWSSGNNRTLGLFLGALFLLMIGLGFFLNNRSFQGYRGLLHHSGRAMADFVALETFPLTLINMGLVGSMGAAYVLLVGGDLNGPTVGAVLAISGFGAFGKHPRNIIAPVVGVVLSSLVTIWEIGDPNVLLAALFATGLAPIAGQFGWRWGIVAGMIHASVVLNVSVLHGGLNLYNNGFSAGLVCIVLLPLIEGLQAEASARGKRGN